MIHSHPTRGPATFSWQWQCLNIVAAFALLCVLIFSAHPAMAKEEEKTYDIDLVKTMEVSEDIYEVDNKKVLTETFTIRKGDWIWKVLREKGLLKRRNLGELISVLKKLNKSLTNLDLVRPGDRIIIPLKIAPVSGSFAGGPQGPEEVTSIAALKDVNFENYTVKPDDSVVKVVTGRYNIPEDRLYREYLDLVKKLNPNIKDLDLIHPGQVIRLPIYSPQVVRRPIEKAPPPPQAQKEEAAGEPQIEKLTRVAGDLAAIFREMGEEWVQTGKHFIPLKSGGQVDLRAESFPLLNLRSGMQVIVDLHNRLPQKLARLIGASWQNYRVVHLYAGDDLRTAFDRVVRACNYPRIFRKGEALEMEGDMGFKIRGDWIIALGQGDGGKEPAVAVINIHTQGNRASSCPGVLRSYLEGVGVKLIDYPPPEGDRSNLGEEDVEVLQGGDDPASLIGQALDLAGHEYSSQVEIPVYQSRQKDFKLIIKADFSLKAHGKDAIISLHDLGQEVVSLLKEQGFEVLSLWDESDPLAMISRTLKFIGLDCRKGPHVFTASEQGGSREIALTLPGVLFNDAEGKPVLATKLNLPGEIAAFLSQKGYRVLRLTALSTGDVQHS